MDALNYPDCCISYENEKDTSITLKISPEKVKYRVIKKYLCI